MDKKIKEKCNIKKNAPFCHEATEPPVKNVGQTSHSKFLIKFRYSRYLSLTVKNLKFL